MAERYSSDEMEDLMNRLQQLLERKVLCVVLVSVTGKVSVACPTNLRETSLNVLRTVDWQRVR